MGFENKSLQCSDCGATFVFSAEEQDQFATRGYTNEPKRCPSCRQTRKAKQFGNNGSSYGNSGSSYGTNNYRPVRQMFPAKCSDCGKDTEVPFEPRTGRPVYCSDCYRKVKLSR